jgi:hypothetical protein
VDINPSNWNKDAYHSGSSFSLFSFYMYLTCTLLFVLAEAYDLLDPNIITIKMGFYAMYS